MQVMVFTGCCMKYIQIQSRFTALGVLYTSTKGDIIQQHIDT